MLRVTDGIGLDDRHIEERFVRATGPGGQNIRHEQTAVELRLDIAASPLPADVKDRLRALAGTALTAGDVLVVSSRAHRSQAENRASARLRLVALLQRAARPVRKRRLTRPRRFAREERLASKRRHSVVKALRSRRAD
jgi:ribosome-associated protein